MFFRNTIVFDAIHLNKRGKKIHFIVVVVISFFILILIQCVFYLLMHFT